MFTSYLAHIAHFLTTNPLDIFEISVKYNIKVVSKI